VSNEQTERLLGPKEVGEILSLRRSKIHRTIATGDRREGICERNA
jgi:hypothetical protein